jgi:signal peptidase I
VLVLAVVVVLLVRAFLVQSFSVSSASMQPTIQPGERLLASRLIRGDSVHRGDIVVFDGARAFGNGEPSDDGVVTRAVRAAAWLVSVDTGTDYVKRVVGVPGDQVMCCDPSGRLVVNHVGVQESYLFPGDAPSELTFDVTVPPGRIWVMGDHRSASSDSRSYLGHAGGGMVRLDDVIGQVTVRYWPLGRLGSLGGAGALSTVPSMSGAGH